MFLAHPDLSTADTKVGAAIETLIRPGQFSLNEIEPDKDKLSIRGLAKRCRRSPRIVTRSLKALERAGVYRIKRQKKNNRENEINVYTLTFPGEGGVDSMSTGVWTPCDTKKSNGKSNKILREHQASPDGLRQEGKEERESSEQESPPSRTELTSRPVLGDRPETREDGCPLGQPIDLSSRPSPESSPETEQEGQSGGYSAAGGVPPHEVEVRRGNGGAVSLDDDDPAWLAIEYGLETKPLKIEAVEFGGLPPTGKGHDSGHPSDTIPGAFGDALRRLRTATAGLTAMSCISQNSI
jgi:hypothetical protein